MSRLVFLDSGPLGMAASPRRHAQFAEWFATVAKSSSNLAVAEICDYEIRRELLRARRDLGLARLNRLVAACHYEPMSTEIMRKAAGLWAIARSSGQPTADRHALDADVILAAIAILGAEAGHEVVVASDNVGHLSRFVDAWH